MLRKYLIYLSAVIVVIVINLNVTEGALKRCYQCRSRGELGSCKDPFKFNVTQIENEHGIKAVPCASGWCGKFIESQGSLRTDDYDMPTQRMCIQRGPSDAENRCAYTMYNYKKVYMCFCRGDLCNASTALNAPKSFRIFAMASIALVLMRFISTNFQLA